ncbi:MAG: type II toxin-antitoxin system RelE/ParE family toxin [Rhizobium sp.]|nr:type II toxin-antitoxin system RelE/ParE family toxin [Rhizobium sp.]
MSPSRRRWTLTKKAVRDLEEIWRYTFKRWSVEQADSYHNDMIGMFNKLAAGHRLGRKVILPDRTYFCCTTASHNIFFRDEKTRVVIVRILHNRMDPRRHL